jgi:hypothetical protein
MLRDAAIVGVLALAAAGCIVTDKIDFRNDVNYPPQVISVIPDTSAVLTICGGEIPEFDVSLWEPDEEDAPPQTEAEIRVWLDDNSAGGGQVAGDCTVTATSPTEESPYEGGVLLAVVCKMTNFNNPISPPETLLVRVLVSDRPFVEGTPPETARTAEVFWTLEVLSSEECPQ